MISPSSDSEIKNFTRDTIVKCLSQQLSEYELLKSMYPNKSDIILTEKNMICDIYNFVNKKTEYIPNHLDFTLNLNINDLKLEVCINLPSCYPDEEPDLYIRCNQLNRQQESKLNIELSDYLKNNHMGEVCLYTAISWLNDNIDNFCSISVNDVTGGKLSDERIVAKDNVNFVRLWIFSHHIYNKKKREEIGKKAKELNLTGFCLPGKPGVICIEGENNDCQEWWKDIKSMNWKKIMIRKTETLESLESQRKFTIFEEIHFKNNANSKTANMSEFSKYMSELGFSQVFSEFFGLCNE